MTMQVTTHDDYYYDDDDNDDDDDDEDVCDPSDQNESHVENFDIWVLYIVLKKTSLALKLHQELDLTFHFDKVMKYYLSTLWKLLAYRKCTYSPRWCEMEIP